MKTVSREFWISETGARVFGEGKYIPVYNEKKTEIYSCKLTMTVELPDLRIEISKEEFDRAVQLYEMMQKE